MNRIAGAALTFIVAFGFYLFLAGKLDAVEVTAGLVCATAALVITMGMNHVAERHYAFRPPLRALLNPFAALVPEAVAVGRVLVAVIITGIERQRGDFMTQPFEAGDGHEAATRGRRALSVLGISLAPRTFVVRGEAGGSLLLHGLPAQPVSPNRRWPA